MSAHDYVAYGAALSSDIDLGPHLHRTGTVRGRVDLRAGNARLPEGEAASHPVADMLCHGRQLVAHSDAPVDAVVSGQPWWVSVEDDLFFHWRSGEPEVIYELSSAAGVKELAFWFTHMVLPIILASNRALDFLHAASVDVGGQALVLLAPSQGGKSTLAGTMVERGHALITDDKLGTYREADRFFALPSHGYHRPFRAPGHLGIPAARTTAEATPIGLLCTLERVGAENPVRIEAVQGSGKFAHVLHNSVFAFRFRARDHLAYVSALLNEVPLVTLQVPDDIERLGEVCGQLEAFIEKHSMKREPPGHPAGEVA